MDKGREQSHREHGLNRIGSMASIGAQYVSSVSDMLSERHHSKRPPYPFYALLEVHEDKY